jgi:hypothetical protein
MTAKGIFTEKLSQLLFSAKEFRIEVKERGENDTSDFFREKSFFHEDFYTFFTDFCQDVLPDFIPDFVSDFLEDYLGIMVEKRNQIESENDRSNDGYVNSNSESENEEEKKRKNRSEIRNENENGNKVENRSFQRVAAEQERRRNVFELFSVSFLSVNYSIENNVFTGNNNFSKSNDIGNGKESVEDFSQNNQIDTNNGNIQNTYNKEDKNLKNENIKINNINNNINKNIIIDVKTTMDDILLFFPPEKNFQTSLLRIITEISKKFNYSTEDLKRKSEENFSNFMRKLEEIDGTLPSSTSFSTHSSSPSSPSYSSPSLSPPSVPLTSSLLSPLSLYSEKIPDRDFFPFSESEKLISENQEIRLKKEEEENKNTRNKENTVNGDDKEINLFWGRKLITVNTTIKSVKIIEKWNLLEKIDKNLTLLEFSKISVFAHEKIELNENTDFRLLEAKISIENFGEKIAGNMNTENNDFDVNETVAKSAFSEISNKNTKITKRGAGEENESTNENDNKHDYESQNDFNSPVFLIFDFSILRNSGTYSTVNKKNQNSPKFQINQNTTDTNEKENDVNGNNNIDNNQNNQNFGVFECSISSFHFPVHAESANRVFNIIHEISVIFKTVNCASLFMSQKYTVINPKPYNNSNLNNNENQNQNQQNNNVIDGNKTQQKVTAFHWRKFSVEISGFSVCLIPPKTDSIFACDNNGNCPILVLEVLPISVNNNARKCKENNNENNYDGNGSEKQDDNEIKMKIKSANIFLLTVGRPQTSNVPDVIWGKKDISISSQGNFYFGDFQSQNIAKITGILLTILLKNLENTINLKGKENNLFSDFPSNNSKPLESIMIIPN